MKVVLVSGCLSGHLVTLCNAPRASSETCRGTCHAMHAYVHNCTFKEIINIVEIL